VGGPFERGVEVVEPQVRLGRAGQVDGMAARVLVITARYSARTAPPESMNLLARSSMTAVFSAFVMCLR
jgi:hypothetical protein